MNRFFILLLSLLAVFRLQGPALATDTVASPELLPQLTLTAPDSPEYRLYLGLKQQPGEAFNLGDIDADLLLIQLFSMYCPFCQEEAENVNALFDVIYEFSKPDFSIKMIGIGANNSVFEVDHYRNTYGVRFPLFSDQDMTIYNALGGKGTPGFIACRKQQDNSCVIVHRQSGGFVHVDEFFKELLRKSNYSQ
jgi:peroxiredoxin